MVDPTQLGDWTSLRDRWAIGGLLTLLFSGLARWVHGVTTAGALAGAVVCFILYLGGGPGAFAALITVFSLAWITTRLGYSHKQKLGIAERREGRSASQVLANLGVATICATFLIFGVFGQTKAALLAMSAALSEAAADTVSSEIGQAFGETPRLITSWKSVPAGTNGAVSRGDREKRGVRQKVEFERPVRFSFLAGSPPHGRKVGGTGRAEKLEPVQHDHHKTIQVPEERHGV